MYSRPKKKSQPNKMRAAVPHAMGGLAGHVALTTVAKWRTVALLSRREVKPDLVRGTTCLGLQT
jgi:hypothetical protein